MLFLSWVSKPCPRTVGRGPVPRRALVCHRNRPEPLGCGRFSFRRRDCGGQIICLISVVQDRPILNRSGSGDPELLRLILFQTNEGLRGTGPRATVAAAFFFEIRRETTLTKNTTFAKITLSFRQFLSIFRVNSTVFTIFRRKTLTKNRNSYRMWLLVNISTIFREKCLTFIAFSCIINANVVRCAKKNAPPRD